MLKRTLAALATGLMLTAGLSAQETTPQAPTPAPRLAVPPPRTEGQPVNIKLDLTITDQTGPGDPGKRTVTMIVADRQSGSIRSGGNVMLAGHRIDVNLNVDARPALIEGNRMRLDLTLEYAPKPVTENATTGEGRAHLTERLGLIVEAGKRMIISEASDPTSDRKIVVELLATVLK